MRFKKILKFTFLLLVVWFLGHLTYITVDGLTNTHKKADLIVILGNKVNPDGNLSERLKQRVDCGYQLYRDGLSNKILVSGGLGKEGFYEGTKMKDDLLRRGIPTQDIIVDNKGNNTTATVDNTLKLRDSLHFNSIIVVSQFFHVTRTKKLFRDRNFKAVESSNPKYFELRDLYSMTREFFAYYTQ